MNFEKNFVKKDQLSGREVQAEDVDAQRKYEMTLEFLDQIDFEVLNQIFREIKGRSKDYRIKGENFISKRIIAVYPEGKDVSIRGTYSPKDGIQMLAGYLEEPRVDSEEEFRNHMMSLLVHESVHATEGRRNYVSFFANLNIERLKSWLNPVLVTRGGYETIKYIRGQLKHKLNYFNEGVTDLIAEEVYYEYLRRTGDRRLFAKEGRSPKFIEGYKGSRVIMAALIEVVADASGIPSDKVWEGLKQGYMVGLNLEETELYQEFNTLFFKDFISVDDKGTSIRPPIEEMLKKIDRIALSEAAKERIKKSYDVFVQSISKGVDNEKEL